MAFSAKQLRFLDYVEQVYALTGVLPTAEIVAEGVYGLTTSDYRDYMKSTTIIKEFEIRGIQIDNLGNVALTPEQLVCANLLLDFADGRSQKKKLADIGVSSGKYQMWLRDAGFSGYLRSRAESLLPDSMHEAHGALLDTVRKGDVNALKLYYEITGRFSQRSDGQLNVQFFLTKVIEAIQRNVHDEVVVARIADELLSLIPGTSAPSPSKQIERPALPASQFVRQESRYVDGEVFDL